jgi:hypothetical protein
MNLTNSADNFIEPCEKHTESEMNSGVRSVGRVSLPGHFLAGSFTRSHASSLRSELTTGLRGNTISTLRVTTPAPPPISRASAAFFLAHAGVAGQPPMGL